MQFQTHVFYKNPLQQQLLRSYNAFHFFWYKRISALSVFDWEWCLEIALGKRVKPSGSGR